MNVIVYVMCLLNSPMLNLRVIPILCKCMIMRLDLHMRIITIYTFNPRTWYIEIYLTIRETLALEWYEHYLLTMTFDFEKLIYEWWWLFIYTRSHNYEYVIICLASKMSICISFTHVSHISSPNMTGLHLLMLTPGWLLHYMKCLTWRKTIVGGMYWLKLLDFAVLVLVI